MSACRRRACRRIGGSARGVSAFFGRTDHDHEDEDDLSVSTRFDRQDQQSKSSTSTITRTIGKEAKPLCWQLTTDTAN